MTSESDIMMSPPTWWSADCGAETPPDAPDTTDTTDTTDTAEAPDATDTAEAAVAGSADETDADRTRGRDEWTSFSPVAT
jgi:hypothetical protein